jgi:hypothetical protein
MATLIDYALMAGASYSKAAFTKETGNGLLVSQAANNEANRAWRLGA